MKQLRLLYPYQQSHWSSSLVISVYFSASCSFILALALPSLQCLMQGARNLI